MKPKTKLQHAVMELSASLLAITDEQRKWGIANCLSHQANRTKNKTNCMDCGQSWPSQNNTLLLTKLVDEVTCPHCNVKLQVKDTKQRVFAQREFYAILDKKSEFQVIRIFEIRSYHKVGQPGKADLIEVVSQWLLPDGRWEYIARQRGGMGWYNDAFTGYLEVRNKKNFDDKYNIYPTKVYPKMKVLSLYKRNGFKGNWHSLTPHDLLSNLGNPICETLLKAKQYALLLAFVTSRKKSIEKNWASVKLVMRNNYGITRANVITWLDYIDLLTYFGKDVRNASFVCPDNLKQEHDRYVSKKAKAERIKTLEERRAKAEEEQAAYLESKGMFFGMMFTDGELTVKVIETVYEFVLEGEALHHCVWTNNYYKKRDSLILSARVEGAPVETIEINLIRMEINQSRGLNNKATPYSERVRELVRRNMRQVKKHYKKIKNSVAA